jgi:hypothetical protein
MACEVGPLQYQRYDTWNPTLKCPSNFIQSSFSVFLKDLGNTLFLFSDDESVPILDSSNTFLNDRRLNKDSCKHLKCLNYLGHCNFQCTGPTYSFHVTEKLPTKLSIEIGVFS